MEWTDLEAIIRVIQVKNLKFSLLFSFFPFEQVSICRRKGIQIDLKNSFLLM